MKYLLFCLLFVNMSFVSGQPDWHSGAVVLSSDSVLVGLVSVSTNKDLVLFKRETRVDVLPAHTLRSVRFFDSDENVNRRFVTIVEDLPRRCSLFEVVADGEVSVVRRERRFNFNQGSGLNAFDYFVVLADKIVPLRNFRNKVYPFIVRQPGFKDLVRHKGLDANALDDSIEIVMLYNRMFSGNYASLR